MGYLILITSIILFDIVSKNLVVKKIPVGNKITIVKKRLFLWHIKNDGVAYNKLARYPTLIKGITLTSILLLGTYFIGLIKRKDEKWLTLSAALILGGGIANFIDRMKHNHVTDFIYFKGKNMPIFNIADVFIFFGGMICILSSVLQKEK